MFLDRLCAGTPDLDIVPFVIFPDSLVLDNIGTL
jgi:hypothetical protein